MTKARRKKQDIAQVVKKAVMETLEGGSDGSDGDGGNSNDSDPSMPLQYSNIPPEDPESVVDDLLNTIPPQWGNCYAKIYKTRPLPPGVRNHVLLGEIDDLRAVNDLELHVRKMAIENGWGGGEYRVCILRGDNRRIMANLCFEIECPQTIAKDTATAKDKTDIPVDPQVQLQTQLETHAGIQRAIQACIPPAADPNKVIEAQMRAFDQAVAVVAKQGGNGNGSGNSNLEILTTVLKLWSQMQAQQAQMSQTSPLLDPVAMLKSLREAGILNNSAPPPTDSLTELKKLMELGLIDLTRKEDHDPLEQMGKTVDLLKGLLPLFSESTAEKVSPVVELIRVVGPSVPDIVANLTSAVKEVAEVSKMKINARMGMGRATPGTKSTPLASEQKQLRGTTTVPTTPVERNPVITQILSAVRNKDHSFFPQLRQLLQVYVGQHVIDGLISGNTSVELLLSTVANTINEPELNTLQAQAYLKKFIAYITVAVRCTQCGDEFDLDREELERDPKCDCGGTLVPVKQEQVGEEHG